MRYFFITDRVHKGDVKVKWCPTGDMTGDFWTKPEQGAMFCRFRDHIMGVVAQPDPGPGKPKNKALGKVGRNATFGLVENPVKTSK